MNGNVIRIIAQKQEMGYHLQDTPFLFIMLLDQTPSTSVGSTCTPKLVVADRENFLSMQDIFAFRNHQQQKLDSIGPDLGNVLVILSGNEERAIGAARCIAQSIEQFDTAIISGWSIQNISR